MGLVTVPVFTLAAAVANSGTVALDYPQGYTQANFTGSKASARGVAVINSNDIHEEAREKISLSYGASEITLTNFSGVTWNKRDRLLVQLAFVEAASGGGGEDPTPLLPSALTEIFEDASGTPSLGQRLATAVGEAIDALNDAGGEPAEALGDVLAASADSGGTAILPATAAQIRAEAEGFLIATPQGNAEAEVWVEVVPVSGDIEIDGAAGINFYGVVNEASDFIAPLGLTNRARTVVLTATGADRAITATGFNHTVNFGAGVSIPSGKFGQFLARLNAAAETVLTFAGYSD